MTKTKHCASEKTPHVTLTERKNARESFVCFVFCFDIFVKIVFKSILIYQTTIMDVSLS